MKQKRSNVLPWMHGRMGTAENKREFLHYIILGGEVTDVARARFVQIKESSDGNEVLKLFKGFRRKELAAVLRFIEDERAEKWDIPGQSAGELAMEYIFNDKLDTLLQREKLRRYFMTDPGGSALYYGSFFTAQRIFWLLGTERRLESNQGVIWYFQQTPAQHRRPVMANLRTFTERKWGQNAEKALHQHLLPATYSHLQGMKGMYLYDEPRSVGAGEQAALARDYEKIKSEINDGVFFGFAMGALESIYDFVKAIVMTPIDILVLGKELILANLYVSTHGLVGAENYDRVINAFSGIKQFAMSPIDMSAAMLAAAYDDAMLASDVIVGPGSTGRKTRYWLSLALRFIVALAAIAKAVKTAGKAILKRLSRYAATRRVMEQAKAFKARMKARKKKDKGKEKKIDKSKETKKKRELSEVEIELGEIFSQDGNIKIIYHHKKMPDVLIGVARHEAFNEMVVLELKNLRLIRKAGLKVIRHDPKVRYISLEGQNRAATVMERVFGTHTFPESKFEDALKALQGKQRRQAIGDFEEIRSFLQKQGIDDFQGLLETSTGKFFINDPGTAGIVEFRPSQLRRVENYLKILREGQ